MFNGLFGNTQLPVRLLSRKDVDTASDLAEHREAANVGRRNMLFVMALFVVLATAAAIAGASGLAVFLFAALLPLGLITLVVHVVGKHTDSMLN